MKKNKFNNIKGITLAEILIGIVVSSIMMIAMYTSYSVVNNSYSQVTDRAKISQTGRDIIGMLVRDIRMAGYKYFGDNIKTSNEHIPILITKSITTGDCCDQIDIVYGSIEYDKDATPPNTFVRYKITYLGKPSTIIDKKTSATAGSTNYIDAFAIYKSKKKWDTNTNSWDDPSLDSDEATYPDQLIVDYVQDMEFIAIGEDGLKISPPPTYTNANKEKVFKIKVVDIIITTRSTKPFYKSNITKTILALGDSTRNITTTDKYLRDSIIVSAHARNLGLQ